MRNTNGDRIMRLFDSEINVTEQVKYVEVIIISKLILSSKSRKRVWPSGNATEHSVKLGI